MATLLALRSHRSAAVDALRPAQASALAQVAGIVGFALLTALGAQIRVYVWEIPFTLQTLAVYGSGLYLGWRNGLLAQVLYLALGLLFPVYVDGAVGPAYLFGAPTAGYLLAFPLAAAVAGALSARWNTLAGSTLSMLAASAVIFTGGVAWLYASGLYTPLGRAIEMGWLRFVPIDLLKVMSVALLYTASRRVKA